MDCLSLPFTRQVSQAFGSEPAQVPFYALFAFFAVDRKCRFRANGLSFRVVRLSWSQLLFSGADSRERRRRESWGISHPKATEGGMQNAECRMQNAE